MAQHWLETAAARDMPLERVLRMSEDQAYAWFYRARWVSRCAKFADSSH